jgi:hypothetical protein
MATRNITITYPDGQGARIVAALKTHYGPITEGEPPVQRERTNAEAFAAFEASVKNSLRHIVRSVEQEAARQAANAGVTDPDVA